MIFRWLLAIAFGVIILNLEAVGLPGGNPLEKGLIMAAAIVLVCTRRRFLFVLIALGLMILVTFFSGLFTRNAGFSWSVYLLSLNQIVAPMLFLAAIPTEEDRDFALKLSSFAPIACAILGVIYDTVGIRDMIGIVYESGTARFQGTLIPAFFAGFAMTGAIAAMFYANLKDRRYLIVAAINLLLLIASGARVPTVVGVVICAAIFFRGFAGARQLKLVTILASFGAVAIILNTVGAGLVDRFADQSLSGRDLMWSFLEVIASNYSDFGVGFGHQMSIVPREIYIMTGSSAAHNDFLRSAVEIGAFQSWLFYGIFVGTLLWLWAVIYRFNLFFLFGILAYMGLSVTDNTLASVSHFPILYITAYGALREKQIHAQSAANATSTARDLRPGLGIQPG